VREIGERIQRFEIKARLGSGGMGTVLHAHDPQLERDVALKLLNAPRGSMPRLSEHETLDLRSDAPPTTSSEDLLHEARMMARLSHPNVVSVYEVGLTGETVFVVMEHIDGTDLATWLPGKSRRRVLDMMAQAGAGLAAAHAHSIVHGDFKPHNVLVGADGRVRVADFGLARLAHGTGEPTRGTPHYMAPELWVGAKASVASDVYAFCVTLAEALGAKLDDIRGTLRAPPRLRAAILAGTADNPAGRPALASILPALQAGSSRRAWLAMGALGVAAIAGIAFAQLGGDADSCTMERSLGRWHVGSDVVVRAVLGGANLSDADRRIIDRVVDSFTNGQKEIDQSWSATCRDVKAGRLTARQAKVSQSCLMRRQIELGVKSDYFLTKRPKRSSGAERARLWDTSDCDDVSSPLLPTDLAPVIALFGQLFDVDAAPAKLRIAGATEVARQAAAIGERELEARAMLSAAAAYTEGGQLTQADELAEAAYRKALDLSSLRMQAMALTLRTRLATKRGDANQALSFGKLTLAIAERSSTAPTTRARIYTEMARAAYTAGDGPLTLELVEKGMSIIREHELEVPYVEASLRLDRTNGLGLFNGKKLEALAAGEETLAWMEQTFGQQSKEYAVALQVYASQLRWNDKVELALQHWERAYAIRKQINPEDPSLPLVRGDIARLYERLGNSEQALKMYEEELAEAPHSELVRAQVPLITIHIGMNQCGVGNCEQGYATMQRGLELGIAQHGADHRTVAEFRDNMLAIELAIGKWDAAERNIQALRRLWEGDYNKRLSLGMLAKSEAELTLYRGNAAKAEQQARKALAAWDEMKGDDVPRAAIIGTLVDTLIEQRKWKEARTMVERAYEITRARELRIASLHHEVRLAEIEVGEGKLAIAKQRAERALAELPTSSVGSRRRAEALLKRRR
jgi:serine/threonine-protein kinase